MIIDNMLSAMAKALNSEGFTVPAYQAYGSTSTVIQTDTSSLAGEYPTRDLITGSRVTNVTTYTSIRSGAVASSTGDVLFNSGLYDSSTAGDLQAAVTVPSVLHTTSFDLEQTWEFTVNRV